MTFGTRIRRARERRNADDRAFSMRKVAQRIGVEPAYLSKIERGIVPPPSEATIRKLAAELGEDTDSLLAGAGKVSSEVRDIILKRPMLMAELVRSLEQTPDQSVQRVIRQVRDGDW